MLLWDTKPQYDKNSPNNLATCPRPRCTASYTNVEGARNTHTPTANEITQTHSNVTPFATKDSFPRTTHWYSHSHINTHRSSSHEPAMVET